ncbi:hypothetical protein PR048_033637 [Dryococelus australis]|uniref:Uncharacterized protein n=1 Tax=Dryococelus australis TaxID=614101 RepID=A0ABQ9G428_9NEOP|nr:hypothetical protein PR048_033637 [Dryococelus australis]
MSTYTRQKAKSKYRNRIRLERESQKQSSDTHKTPYDRVKRCRERVCPLQAGDNPSPGRGALIKEDTKRGEVICWRDCTHLATGGSLEVDPAGNGRKLCCRECIHCGAAVAEWLTCSPPTKANRVKSHTGSLRIFASGNRTGRFPVSPPPLNSGAAPSSPHFTLIGTQDIVVMSRRNLPTQLNCMLFTNNLLAHLKWNGIWGGPCVVCPPVATGRSPPWRCRQLSAGSPTLVAKTTISSLDRRRSVSNYRRRWRGEDLCRRGDTATEEYPSPRLFPPKPGWPDRGSNPGPPEYESSELPLRHLAHCGNPLYRPVNGIENIKQLGAASFVVGAADQEDTEMGEEVLLVAIRNCLITVSYARPRSRVARRTDKPPTPSLAPTQPPSCCCTTASHTDKKKRLGLAVLGTRPFVLRECAYVDALGRLDSCVARTNRKKVSGNSETNTADIGVVENTGSSPQTCLRSLRLSNDFTSDWGRHSLGFMAFWEPSSKRRTNRVRPARNWTQTRGGAESSGTARRVSFYESPDTINYFPLRCEGELPAMFMLPEADSRRRLTTAGHTHLQCLLGPLPRRQKDAAPRATLAYRQAGRPLLPFGRSHPRRVSRGCCRPAEASWRRTAEGCDPGARPLKTARHAASRTGARGAPAQSEYMSKYKSKYSTQEEVLHGGVAYKHSVVLQYINYISLTSRAEQHAPNIDLSQSYTTVKVTWSTVMNTTRSWIPLRLAAVSRRRVLSLPRCLLVGSFYGTDAWKVTGPQGRDTWPPDQHRPMGEGRGHAPRLPPPHTTLFQSMPRQRRELS